MEKPTSKDIYKIALEIRNFEINLFWQRSNYFLILNIALATGLFSVTDSKYAITISIFGLISSILWVLINHGSKYWQSRWEHRLTCEEINLNTELNREINFFLTDLCINDVKRSLANNEHCNFRRKTSDKLILIKPSVSLMIILLPILFVLFWISSLIFSYFGYLPKISKEVNIIRYYYYYAI
ncbi:MAG: hypothetical protein WBV23_07930 [Desulfobaccales bacterium]